MIARVLPPRVTFTQCVRLGYAGRIESRNYLGWLRGLPCATCDKFPTMDVANDASHLNGGKGHGTKFPDWLAIPQCRECHERYEREPLWISEDAFLALVCWHLLQAIYERRLTWQKV